MLHKWISDQPFFSLTTNYCISIKHIRRDIEKNSFTYSYIYGFQTTINENQTQENISKLRQNNSMLMQKHPMLFTSQMSYWHLNISLLIVAPKHWSYHWIDHKYSKSFHSAVFTNIFYQYSIILCPNNSNYEYVRVSNTKSITTVIWSHLFILSVCWFFFQEVYSHP